MAYDPANGFRPGGGFSNYFGQPSWQKTAVESYLNIIGNANKGLFNTSGRAYPDLAAYGVVRIPSNHSPHCPYFLLTR